MAHGDLPLAASISHYGSTWENALGWHVLSSNGNCKVWVCGQDYFNCVAMSKTGAAQLHCLQQEHKFLQTFTILYCLKG